MRLQGALNQVFIHLSNCIKLIVSYLYIESVELRVVEYVLGVWKSVTAKTKRSPEPGLIENLPLRQIHFDDDRGTKICGTILINIYLLILFQDHERR